MSPLSPQKLVIYGTGGVGRELWERLQCAAGWSERFAVCDAVLSRVVTDRAVAPELRRSWDVLRPGGRLVTIAASEEGSQDERTRWRSSSWSRGGRSWKRSRG